MSFCLSPSTVEYVSVLSPAGPRPASNFLFSLLPLPLSPPANRARRCCVALRPFGSALLMHVVAALDQMESGENLEAVAHTPDVSRASPTVKDVRPHRLAPFTGCLGLHNPRAQIKPCFVCLCFSPCSAPARNTTRVLDCVFVTWLFFCCSCQTRKPPAYLPGRCISPRIPSGVSDVCSLQLDKEVPHDRSDQLIS